MATSSVQTALSDVRGYVRRVVATPKTQQLVEPGRQFVSNSVMLVRKCTKPDLRELKRLAAATATGLAIMGFTGFFVKLFFIPIKTIIL